MFLNKIRKRDGSVVQFEEEKITEAIWKAAKAVGGNNRELAEHLGKVVVDDIQEKFDNRIPNVEEVQDIVEKALIEAGHAKTAKAYILYRKSHQELREVKAIFDTIEVIEDYVGEKDWAIKENANMGFSLQGLNNFITEKIVKNYWLGRVYPEAIRKAHEHAEIHIHDLGILGPYCVGWDLKDLLLQGFKGVPGKAQSSPAKHLRTALGQIVNFFYTLQGESAGAQAFSNFDTLLAPFIRYDNLNYKEVKQCMQEFCFNMAVPTRVGFQSPFSNITLDLKVPDYMLDEPVIIGGKPQKESYKAFQKEMLIFNKAFAEVMSEGDATGRVFTFPIPTYNITKDFDWENPDYNPIWEMTAKYGIPYFSNFINSDMKPEDARSMCLHGDEELLIKMNGKIERTTMKDLIETYGGEGWSECKEDIQVMSLNENYKMEWAKIRSFLKAQKKGLIKIRTKDGKFCRFSTNHPVLILDKEGLKQKLANEISPEDYMISLKSAAQLLSKSNKKIGHYPLNANLAFLLGFFTADGNYLYDTRKVKRIRGLQFTFDSRSIQLVENVKETIKSIFGYQPKEKKDPRYNTCYLYIYNTEIANLFYTSGFKKYGRLPNILFDSPKEIIESFLEGFFTGDGYEKRKEIHIKDSLLIRDLAILYSLVGIPNILKIKNNSQRLYLQHKTNTTNIINQPVNCLYDLVPGFLAKSTFLVPGLVKSRMIGQATLQKYNAETGLSLKIASSDFYPVRVTEIEVFNNLEDFYDIELAENNMFVHSLGTITHNCCRLRLNQTELRKRGGGLFGANPLTGSLGVVTINMPRIGFTSASEADFFNKLNELMELAKESLEIKRKVLESLTVKGLYPYSKFYLRNIHQRFNQYWKNHFSTIGLLGMNEALVNFMNKDITTAEGKAFTLKVLDFMREKISAYQQETGNIYNLEATPGEGTTYRFAREDKRRFGRIKVANETNFQSGAKPYYTNSTQLPVTHTDDLFYALAYQDPIQVKYTGGTVFHAYVGEKLNQDAVKILVKKIAESFSMPYFTITPTFSVCPIHGYLQGEHEYCPICEQLPEQPLEHETQNYAVHSASQKEKLEVEAI